VDGVIGVVDDVAADGSNIMMVVTSAIRYMATFANIVPRTFQSPT